MLTNLTFIVTTEGREEKFSNFEHGWREQFQQWRRCRSKSTA